MKFNFGRTIDPNLFDCENPKPGLYRSAKGSVLIKPENNVTDKGNEGTQSDHVLIWDVDTGRTIVKQCSEVKAEYTFVADLDAVEVTVNVGKDCPCKAVQGF